MKPCEQLQLSLEQARLDQTALPEEVRAHLAGCAACQAHERTLAALLDAALPRPDEELLRQSAHRTQARVQAALAQAGSADAWSRLIAHLRDGLSWPRLALATSSAVAALLALTLIVPADTADAEIAAGWLELAATNEQPESDSWDPLAFLDPEELRVLTEMLAPRRTIDTPAAAALAAPDGASDTGWNDDHQWLYF